MDSINNIIKKIRESRILNEKEEYEDKETNDLISLAQSGDHLAIETLIRKYKNLIQKMARTKFMPNADIDDMEQLATIGLWDAIMRYDSSSSGNFEAFAGMVIKRKLTDELRKEDTYKRVANAYTTSLDANERTEDDAQFPNSMTKGEFSSLLRDTGGSAEDVALGNRGYDELLKYMKGNLSDVERKAILMYIKGYKVSEIAEVTGMKYKSVENALMRVKNKISDYQRTRESKRIREGVVEFTDEEKKVIKNIIDTINNEK